MKILHVLNTSKFSGAENVVCQIIGLFENDNNIEMAYCSPDGSIREALQERGIVFYPVLALNAKELKKVIKDFNPDIVHAHDMKASFISSLCCGKRRLISHIHNNAFDSRSVNIKSIAYLGAGRKAKHIFWVSQSAFEGYAFHNLLKEKSEVLYNIIDIDALYQRVERDKNSYDYDVIYLGRFTRPKNPMRLLDVCKLLVEKKSDIRIAFVGTGEMEQEVKLRAKDLGLLANIDFLGFQPNPTKILKDSKVMIMTSLWEGTPMCALEAAALGTPIVSTPVDGLRDLIVNNETGFLTDDNIEISNKIIQLILDECMLQTMSDNQIKKSMEWNNKEVYKSKLLKEYMGERIYGNRK